MLQSSVSLQLGNALLVSAIVLIAIVVALFLYFVVWALFRKPVTGVESMKGRIGVVVSDFQDGAGEVFVDGVIWKAKSSDGSRLSKDNAVVVVDVSALELLVRKQ